MYEFFMNFIITIRHFGDITTVKRIFSTEGNYKGFMLGRIIFNSRAPDWRDDKNDFINHFFTSFSRLAALGVAISKKQKLFLDIHKLAECVYQISGLYRFSFDQDKTTE